jgi:hypothetical protein
VKSRLSFLGSYDFYRIDSTLLANQSEALILSDPSFGVRLNWSQAWSDKWAYNLSGDKQRLPMRFTSWHFRVF